MPTCADVAAQGASCQRLRPDRPQQRRRPTHTHDSPPCHGPFDELTSGERTWTLEEEIKGESAGLETLEGPVASLGAPDGQPRRMRPGRCLLQERNGS